MQTLENAKICPKCLNAGHVREKKLLIGKVSPKLLFSEEMAGYRRRDQLAVDECKPDASKATPLNQFVDGYYCEKCGIGFVPDDFVI